MKLITFIVLIFSSMGCFAISQRLVDGADRYDVAAANLDKIISAKSEANLPLGEWIKELNKSTDKNLTDDDRKLARNKLGEADRKFNDLRRQQAVYEEEIKKLAPIKAEYVKQMEAREDLKNRILDIVSKLAILSLFALVIGLIIFHHRKYKRLLAEKKITQTEYDRITQCSESSTFSNRGTNPATGLPMVGIGISDVGGNIRGSSSNCSSNSGNSNSIASSNYQTYQNRYR